MAKQRVTTQQLGEILYIFALETALDNLKNEEIVKNLNLEDIDQIIQIQEMIMIYMFGTLIILQNLNVDENEYKEILDFMHKAYDETLIQKLNFNKEQLQIAHYNIRNRYKEYLLAKRRK
jgi:hypothetical protein